MADFVGTGLFMLFTCRNNRRTIARVARRRANIAKIIDASNRRTDDFLRLQANELSAFLLQLLTLVTFRDGPQRQIWTRERSGHWWSEIVNQTFGDRDWLANFRMRRATFQHLVAELAVHIGRADTHMRRCITVEVRVAVTLWLLATGSGYRGVGHLFGIAKSSCCEIFHETCAVIVKILMPKYIKMPTEARWQEIIDGFEAKFGFPNCGGVIDGTHIPIIAPQLHHTDYHNRKGYYSIVAQVVCDHEYQVINIAAGWPGRVHDARVLANSSLYAKGEAGTLLPDRPKDLGHATVPVVMLGDPAYPLRPWLMKPFSDTGRLTQEQTLFNYRLSRARMTIENTFGRCKARWRILQRRTDIRTEDVTTVILACFTLNNICEIHKEVFNDDWDAGPNEEPQNRANVIDAEGNGSGIRQAYVDYFSS